MPFDGQTDRDILLSVAFGRRRPTTGPYWENVSEPAKSFVDCLLCTETSERLDASEALLVPWVVNNGVGSGLKHAMSPQTLKALQCFGAAQAVKKAALCWIAENSSLPRQRVSSQDFSFIEHGKVSLSAR